MDRIVDRVQSRRRGLDSKNRIETDLATERTVAQEVGPRCPVTPKFRVNTQCLVLAVMPSKVLKAPPVVTSIIGALTASAILNRVLAKKAERRNPPMGRFITVDGVRLHYLERGTGRPLGPLHGRGG